MSHHVVYYCLSHESSPVTLAYADRLEPWPTPSVLEEGPSMCRSSTYCWASA